MRLRKVYGFSQARMAQVMRSDARTIRRWERGEYEVSGPASIVLELMDAGELPVRFIGE